MVGIWRVRSSLWLKCMRECWVYPLPRFHDLFWPFSLIKFLDDFTTIFFLPCSRSLIRMYLFSAHLLSYCHGFQELKVYCSQICCNFFSEFLLHLNNINIWLLLWLHIPPHYQTSRKLQRSASSQYPSMLIYSLCSPLYIYPFFKITSYHTNKIFHLYFYPNLFLSKTYFPPLFPSAIASLPLPSLQLPLPHCFYWPFPSLPLSARLLFLPRRHTRWSVTAGKEPMTPYG